MSNARKSLVRTALLAFVVLGMLGAEAEAQTFLRNRISSTSAIPNRI